MNVSDLPALAAGAGGVVALFGAIKTVKVVARVLAGVRDYFGRVKAEVELLRSLPGQIEKIASTPVVTAVDQIATPAVRKA